MNRETLWKRLASLQESDLSSNDPEIQEILEALRQYPDLEKKWKNQSLWDQSIRNAIQQVPVPEDLKSRILNSQKNKQSSRNFSEVSRSKIIPFPIARSLSWAAAALVVLSFVFWNFTSSEDSYDFVRFEEKAVDYTQGLFALSYKTDQLDAIRGWLAKEGRPHSFSIPFQTTGLEGLGCKQVNFAGIVSSMICFEVSGSKKEVHLFVMNKEAIHRLPTYGVPEFRERKGNAVAAWSDDRYAYVLTGDVSLEEMKKLF